MLSDCLASKFEMLPTSLFRPSNCFGVNGTESFVLQNSLLLAYMRLLFLKGICFKKKIDMSRKVNFGTPGPLQVIPEDSGHHGDDTESLASDDLGLERPRHHSIHQIMSAKSAARLFRQRSIDMKKNKRRDDGFSEVSQRIPFLLHHCCVSGRLVQKNQQATISLFLSFLLSFFWLVENWTASSSSLCSK